MGIELILASASPRRVELLGKITKNFRVQVSEVSEDLPQGITPRDAVEMLSLRKAMEVAKANPAALVIGSDTVVAIDDQILGKPTDKADACCMLRRLSGREHVVYTGVALCMNGKSESFVSQTSVRFNLLSDEMITAYVESGEPMDKAGAYGIQDIGSILVEKIDGDYFTVMGLPVSELYKRLKNYPIGMNI